MQRNRALKSKHLIPEEVISICKKLQDAGFEAFIVGGSVRDLLIGREPKDWDVTTDAIPEEIIAQFDKTFYENTYGTVGIVYEKKNTIAVDQSTEPIEQGNDIHKKTDAPCIVEVTPYRTESGYSDGRRPDKVSFSKEIKDDLGRRDFTINAIAYDPIKDILVDMFGGEEDIENRLIRCVGDAKTRLNEDGLRIMRAVRLSAELGFTINTDTLAAITVSHEMLGKIAKERIRDEFVKIIMSDNPMVALFMCQKIGILKYIIPELEEGLHTKQNQAHSYDVFEHLLRSLQCAADKKYPFEVRLSALLHDIGKPKSRRFSKEKGDYTFYGHEVIGATMAKEILHRLHFSKKTIDLVYTFVRWHMFFSDTEQISLSAVRRMVANVGKENIWNLMNLRVCDRVGTGRPKENPYRLRKYTAMIDQVLRDPISVSMLKINGSDLINTLHMEPGPRIGYILASILEEVLEMPEKNTVEALTDMAIELNRLDTEVLKEKAESGKKARDKAENEEIGKILSKHNVK